MSEDKFSYSYSPARSSEADRIAAKYISAESKADSDLDRLRRLDRQAELPGTFAGITVGILGVLMIGLGLSLVLSFDYIVAGVIVGVIGIAAAGIATPVSKAVTKRSRNRYRDEILALSEKIKNGG